MKDKLAIAFTAWLQVALISANTHAIANSNFVLAGFLGFFISLVWTFNVKKTALGTNWDRLTYAGGAACGTLTGLGVMVALT